MFSLEKKLEQKKQIDQYIQNMSNLYSVLMSAIEDLDSQESTNNLINEETRETLVTIKEKFDI